MTRTGLDILCEQKLALLKDRSFGLLVHPASVNKDLKHILALLIDSGHPPLRLFGPQHGIRGETQDNMIEWQGFQDPDTGIEICSLYGTHRKPVPEMLAGLDMLVVDLQDVGARYYTFIWTLLLCMQACAENHIKVLVLDRPNPIGCNRKEGPLLDMAFASFVGMAPIPVRHGMTIGELARFFNTKQNIGCELDVIPMNGYHRNMFFEDTGLPWVPPSPNMPTVDTAMVYPGFCLLEATNLSEGRGTTRPFEIFGAPFICPGKLTERLNRLNLPGVFFRPMHFKPCFQKWAGNLCGGAQIHVTDRHTFEPLFCAVSVLSMIHTLYPDDIEWNEPPYEYEEDKMPVDILYGSPALRKGIDSGACARDIAASWRAENDSFRTESAESGLYE